MFDLPAILFIQLRFSFYFQKVQSVLKTSVLNWGWDKGLEGKLVGLETIVILYFPTNFMSMLLCLIQPINQFQASEKFNSWVTPTTEVHG